ncbi:UNVERIFIED_CONTAM: hypothetical protein NCL1_43186 [Trichonephila clavipes]
MLTKTDYSKPLLSKTTLVANTRHCICHVTVTFYSLFIVGAKCPALFLPTEVSSLSLDPVSKYEVELYETGTKQGWENSRD